MPYPDCQCVAGRGRQEDWGAEEGAGEPDGRPGQAAVPGDACDYAQPAAGRVLPAEGWRARPCPWLWKCDPEMMKLGCGEWAEGGPGSLMDAKAQAGVPGDARNQA